MLILSFFAGVLLALQIPQIPSIYWLGLFFPGLLLARFCPVCRVFLAFSVGILWVFLHAQIYFDQKLEAELVQNAVQVQGVVNSLPDVDKSRIRFNLKVQELWLNGEKKKHPHQIRLSWYGQYENLEPGETWQFEVSLKNAAGMMNPGTFDFERWLLEQDIQAIGYVKKSDKNRRLLPASGVSVNQWRYHLKKRVEEILPDADLRGIVLALLIGDRSQISDEQWQIFTATGTNHLVAISGLHIGLVAGVTFFIFRFIFRRGGKLLLYIPAHKAAAIIALGFAFIYAMLAGFAIPTQRALVMTTVVMLGILLNRQLAFSKILRLALLVVILLDPFAVLSTGFWLSFLAVAAILYTMRSRISPSGLWWQWGRVQWVVVLAIFPVLLVLFQSFSLISPLANLVAVPWVSFLVVPLVLLGGLLGSVPAVPDYLFLLANFFLQAIWHVLNYLSYIPFAQWQQSAPVLWTLLPAMLGVILLLAPKGFPGKYLAFIFLLPLFLVRPPGPETGEAWFTLLDVGQGLSAVVRTKGHTLVFDTGPGFSESFDTGEAVVVPFLKNSGVEKIDTLIVSHGDNDHIGGLQSILNLMPVDKVLTGVKDKIPLVGAKQCRHGQRWQWDGINFQMLHPDEINKRQSENNASCVLQISNAQGAILLTGDIEKAAETQLIKKWQSKLKSQILVAPHHGSNTSSTLNFIETVQPRWVLFPAGYLNRFGFPKPKVVERYRNYGTSFMSTGDAGAITVRLLTSGVTEPEAFRETNRHFWNR